MSGIWGLLAALINSAVLFIAYLFRHSLTEYITSGIRTSFEREIELLKADLRQKESEIVALRGGALAGLSNRQALLATRRLQAVDQLWGSIVSINRYRAAPSYKSILKMEIINKKIANDQKLQKFFKVFSDALDLNKLDASEAEKSRPYVSLRAWALYSAYSAVVIGAVAQLKMLATGVDTTDLFNEQKVVDVLKAALPHRATDLDKLGSSAGYYLLDELEQTLLVELNEILDGKVDDEKSLESSKRILAAAAKAKAEIDTKSAEVESYSQTDILR